MKLKPLIPSQLGKQGYKAWNGLEKFEKIAELGDRAAKSAWKALGTNKNLTGKGADKLQSWIENVNKNYGDKLNDNSIAGAIKEKFGLNSGFKPDGSPYKHLNSLQDRMNGLKRQIGDLQKQYPTEQLMVGVVASNFEAAGFRCRWL